MRNVPGGYVENSLVIFGFLDAAYFHNFSLRECILHSVLLYDGHHDWRRGFVVRHIRLSGD